MTPEVLLTRAGFYQKCRPVGGISYSAVAEIYHRFSKQIEEDKAL